MCVDQDREHAQGLIVFDEAHASHIGREIVNVVRAPGCALTVFQKVEVERKVLDIVETLIPLTERLDIDSADLSVSLTA